jgi:hypothetical protein
MGARDPRWGRRMDRPPGWAESFFAGRSHADREADQEAMLRALLVVGAFLGLIALGLNALFTFAGLRFGWWAVPVFVPVGGWLFASAVCNRLLRPLELDVLRWGQRLRAAGVLMVVLWLVWPLWANPVAGAWKRAHGGIGPLGPRYPLGAILGASPIAMGMVVFLLLGLAMVLAPHIKGREPKYPAPPPGGPEPLRSPLLARRPPRPYSPPSRPPDPLRWPDPPRWR